MDKNITYEYYRIAYLIKDNKNIDIWEYFMALFIFKGIYERKLATTITITTKL
jgi:hypothetical protein